MIAQNKPITKEKVLEQISKTGNTEFEFTNFDIDLDDNLFLPMSALNDLRRIALEGLEQLVLNTYKRNNSNISIDINNESLISNLDTDKQISLLINLIDLNNDYTSLEGIDKLYIPLKYFILPKFETLLKNLANNFYLYVYMPHIILDSRQKNINFNKIKDTFNIKGFVISQISQIETLKDFNLEIIGNFNLNIYNNF